MKKGRSSEGEYLILKVVYNSGSCKKEDQFMVKRNYKDTIFRMLFSDRMNLLSLYNAINGTNYENPEELEIVTLENAIYMGMKKIWLSL